MPIDIQAITINLDNQTDFRSNPEAQRQAMKNAFEIAESIERLEGPDARMNFEQRPIGLQIQALKERGLDEGAGVMSFLQQRQDKPWLDLTLRTAIELVRKVQNAKGFREILELLNTFETSLGKGFRKNQNSGIGPFYEGSTKVFFQPVALAALMASPFVGEIIDEMNASRKEKREQYEEAARKLRVQATPGLTLSGAVTDRQPGKVLAAVGDRKLVLLNIEEVTPDREDRSGCLVIGIIDSTFGQGLWRSIVTDHQFIPVKGRWPASWYPEELQRTFQWEEQREKPVRNLKALASALTTLSSDPREKAVSRILLGERAAVLFEIPVFEWNDQKGPVTMLVGRNDNLFVAIHALEHGLSITGPKIVPLEITNQNGIPWISAPKEANRDTRLIHKVMVIRIYAENPRRNGHGDSNGVAELLQEVSAALKIEQ